MRINALEIKNFRKFKSQFFGFHPQFNVLIGDNAKGKTQVLDAISIILGVYQSKLLGMMKVHRGIRNEEVRVEERSSSDEEGNVQIRRTFHYPIELRAKILYDGKTFEQNCIRNTEKGRTTFGRESLFAQRAKEDYEHIISGQSITLPFLGYYGVGRLTPILKHSGKPCGVEREIDGYVGSLDPRNDVKTVQSWLKRRQLIQMETEKKDVPFELVRQAIRSMIPNNPDVYYSFQYDDVSLKYDDGTRENFSNMSDGFRSMVSMTTDIARRIAIMNPHLGTKALEQTKGIVLIDELDLYLHPKWQRRVVYDLKKTFPSLQFIVTSHSPFILQSASSGEVIDLEACQDESTMDEDEFNENFAYPGPGQRYANRSIEDILEGVMGVEIPQRSLHYQKMYDTAREYFLLLQKGKNASEEEKKRIKEKLDELSARFSENVAYSAFLETKRRVAFGDED